MKVGDYVRYVDVFNNTIKIRKINEIIPPDKLIKKDVYFFNNKECSLKEDIIKSSPNIIDLIEVGDIITTNNLCGEITKIDSDKIYTTCYDGEYCSAEDIKSIVTKEQFEAMQYKVGE